MLTTYIRKAMNKAHYELLEDGTIYGAIANCPGVWSNSQTLEECREELQSVLEGWLILKLRDRDPIPEIDGLSLSAEVA